MHLERRNHALLFDKRLRRVGKERFHTQLLGNFLAIATFHIKPQKHIAGDAFAAPQERKNTRV